MDAARSSSEPRGTANAPLGPEGGAGLPEKRLRAPLTPGSHPRRRCRCAPPSPSLPPQPGPAGKRRGGGSRPGFPPPAPRQTTRSRSAPARLPGRLLPPRTLAWPVPARRLHPTGPASAGATARPSSGDLLLPPAVARSSPRRRGPGRPAAEEVPVRGGRERIGRPQQRGASPPWQRAARGGGSAAGGTVTHPESVAQLRMSPRSSRRHTHAPNRNSADHCGAGRGRSSLYWGAEPQGSHASRPRPSSRCAVGGKSLKEATAAGAPARALQRCSGGRRREGAGLAGRGPRRHGPRRGTGSWRRCPLFWVGLREWPPMRPLGSAAGAVPPTPRARPASARVCEPGRLRAERRASPLNGLRAGVSGAQGRPRSCCPAAGRGRGGERRRRGLAGARSRLPQGAALPRAARGAAGAARRGWEAPLPAREAFAGAAAAIGARWPRVPQRRARRAGWWRLRSRRCVLRRHGQRGAGPRRTRALCSQREHSPLSVTRRRKIPTL